MKHEHIKQNKKCIQKNSLVKTLTSFNDFRRYHRCFTEKSPTEKFRRKKDQQ